jgi:hypothetical protein
MSRLDLAQLTLQAHTHTHTHTYIYIYIYIYIYNILILIMLVEVGVVIKSWAVLYRNWDWFLSRAEIRDRTCSPPSSLLNEHFGPLVGLKCPIYKGHHLYPPVADLKNDGKHGVCRDRVTLTGFCVLSYKTVSYYSTDTVDRRQNSAPVL